MKTPSPMIIAEAVFIEVEFVRSNDPEMRAVALTRPRLEDERIPTCDQLRLFTALVTLDLVNHSRKPLERPALRSRRIRVGPVVNSGASDFPGPLSRRDDNPTATVRLVDGKLQQF